MSGLDFIVPPLSWAQIEETASTVSAKLGLADRPDFPIMDVLEKVLDQKLGIVRLEVGSLAAMNGAEGHTDPNGEFIELREDVYHAAWQGDGRARFTAAHELGHFVLHTNTTLARMKEGEDVEVFRRSEPQANQFAAGLLMPVKFFSHLDTAELVMQRHQVSFEAARNRLNFLMKRGWI